MIKLVDVSLSFGGQVILDSITWMLGVNDRAGLVGDNGAGKSTLLKILAGLQAVDRGKREISRGLRIGYLPQEGIVHAGRSLEEEATLGLAPLLDLEDERESIEKELARPELGPSHRDRLLHRLAEIMDRFRLDAGYELQSRVRKVLRGLGFGEEGFSRPVESFSGGWQMRIALAKLLLSEPDVLLLDEPTNHLDLDARNWLEQFLLEYPGSYLIVSHDRYFLDQTVSRIVEIERGRLIDYRGNYSHFVGEKEKRVELAQTAWERQQEEIARLKAFINKYKADKKRTGQVHSRMKMLERIVPLEPPRTSRPIRFKFPPPARGPQDLVRLTGVVKSYGGKKVLDQVNLTLHRGEKIAVVGPNGAGKSTLLAILAGVKDFEAGSRAVNEGVTIAYFGQDAGEELEPYQTVLEAVEKDAPFDFYPRLRALLGAFLFSGEDVDKKVGVLSGGEKSRLALARLLLRPANLLILDEPTNHLDLQAKEVLRNAFLDFAGTLIFVAHDRYFLEALPDRIVEVYDGRVESYPGDYRAYLHAKERLARGGSGEEEKETVSLSAASAEPFSTPKEEDKAERLRRREEEKDRRKMRQRRFNRIKKLEEEIAAAEERMKELEEEMCDSRVASDYKKLIALELEKKDLAAAVERKMAEWEALQAEHEKEEAKLAAAEEAASARRKYLRPQPKES